MGKPMIYGAHRKIERLAKEVYKGYEFAVMSLGTHPCCYIKLPQGHKYYETHYNDIPLEVHGGLTYGEKSLQVIRNVFDESGYWIGWDYAHYGDYYGASSHELGKRWSIEELEKECRDAIDQLSKMDDIPVGAEG